MSLTTHQDVRKAFCISSYDRQSAGHSLKRRHGHSFDPRGRDINIRGGKPPKYQLPIYRVLTKPAQPIRLALLEQRCKKVGILPGPDDHQLFVWPGAEYAPRFDQRIQTLPMNINTAVIDSDKSSRIDSERVSSFRLWQRLPVLGSQWIGYISDRRKALRVFSLHPTAFGLGGDDKPATALYRPGPYAFLQPR